MNRKAAARELAHQELAHQELASRELAERALMWREWARWAVASRPRSWCWRSPVAPVPPSGPGLVPPVPTTRNRRRASPRYTAARHSAPPHAARQRRVRTFAANAVLAGCTLLSSGPVFHDRASVNLPRHAANRWCLANSIVAALDASAYPVAPISQHRLTDLNHDGMLSARGVGDKLGFSAAAALPTDLSPRSWSSAPNLTCRGQSGIGHRAPREGPQRQPVEGKRHVQGIIHGTRHAIQEWQG